MSPENKLGKEPLRFPPTTNHALEAVQAALNSAPLDFARIEQDLLANFDALEDNDLTERKFSPFVLEIHVQQVIEDLMKQGIIGFETVGGITTTNYIFDRPPRANLLLTDKMGTLLTEIDADFKAPNASDEGGPGTHLVGVIEVKLRIDSHAPSGGRKAMDALRPQRINTIGEAIREFSEEEDPAVVGWGYIVVTFPESDSRGRNSNQDLFEAHGGKVAIVSMSRVGFEEHAEDIRQRLLDKRGREGSPLKFRD